MSSGDIKDHSRADSNGVAPRAELQNEYHRAPGTWFYVRGMSAKLAADLDALESAGRQIKATDALLQDALARFDIAQAQLIEDWAYVIAGARRYAERRAELDGAAVVQRPSWEEERQFSAQLAEIETLRRRAIELSPNLREMVTGLFAAAVEYENAEATAKKRAAAIQRMYRNQAVKKFAPLLDLANRAFTATPEQHVVEWAQVGPLFGDDATRALSAYAGVKIAGYVQRSWEKDDNPAYSADVNDLVVTKIETQNVSGIDSAIASFRDAKAENNSAIQITKAIKDGEPVYTVSIPGTVDWSPSGLGHAINLPSNVHTMYGLQSTGMAYVEAAMERAGIEDGADIVMIGHSQGGLIASGLAAKSAFTNKYRVKGLVTMNSPTAHNKIKEGIPTLHLENQRDLVTMLENKSVPVTGDRMQVVGVVDRSDGTKSHDVETSRRLFRDAVSTNAEVRAMAGRIEGSMPSQHEVVETRSYDVKWLK